MKWIEIVLACKSPSGKTNIWSVGNTDNGSRLGEVRWHGPWRKYSFFPAPGCIFEEDCLRDIATFVETATKEHRSDRS